MRSNLKENYFLLLRFSKQILEAILKGFILIPIFLICNTLIAQNIKSITLEKIDSTLIVYDRGNQSRIEISYDMITFYKEGNLIVRKLKTEIEQEVEKFTVQNYSRVIEDDTEKDSFAYEYTVYPGDNLVITKLLVTRQGNANFRTRLFSVLLDIEGHIIGAIYNGFDEFIFFRNKNFMATNIGIEQCDSMYFYNHRCELINKNIRKAYSSVILNNDSNSMKVCSVDGDIAIYNSYGECTFSKNVKKEINRDLFGFYVSPDSSSFLVSTFESKELIMFSSKNNEIFWRINFERVSNCIFHQNNKLLFINTIQQGYEPGKLKYNFYILTSNGKVLKSVQDSELITLDKKEIVLKQGGIYNVYKYK